MEATAPFAVHTARVGPKRVVQWSGDVDRAAATAIRASSAELGLRPGVEVELQLQGVTRIDAIGIGSLLGLLTLAIANRSRLALVGTPPAVRRVLHRVGLSDQLLPEIGPFA